MVLNLKRNKTFKVIITVFMLVTFTVSVISCKEAPAVVEEQHQEDEKPAVEVSNETKEETKEETPPAVEEAPEVIEWEGVTFSPIEGLRFDKGTFFAEAGNPYGLEVGEKAGVFVKDAVEINEKMESAIGLVPKVLEVMQKKIMEEDKEFRYPLPFNFEETKGIRIDEVEFQEADQTSEENRIFDKDTYLGISNIPLKTVIYAPSTTLVEYGEDVLGILGGNCSFYFDIVLGLFKEEIINNYKVNWSKLKIELYPKGVEFVSEETEKEYTQWKRNVESDPSTRLLKMEPKMGTPLVKVIDKVNLMECVYEKDPKEEDVWWVVGYEPTDFQIKMYYQLATEGNYERYKGAVTGLRNLLKIGEMKIFILPAYD